MGQLVLLHRGDCCWATLNHFWTAAEAAGLEGDPTPVEELLIGVRGWYLWSFRLMTHRRVIGPSV
jgi:hypothetical protein